jgi:farnesyl diphosphate synthase
VKYGDDVAILAGDALFAEAVRLVCEHQGGGPAVQVGVLGEISSAAGVVGMVGGQYLDIEDAGGNSPDALARVHALKTGRLMACAVHVALVLAPPPPDQERAYRAFARELGLLFQIVDDILDVTQSAATLGKTAGKDQNDNKPTYVSVLGLEAARRHAQALRSQAHEALVVSGLGRSASWLAVLADKVVEREN